MVTTKRRSAPARRSADARPGAAVGHVFLEVSDVPAAEAWFRALGLRPIASGADYAVMELRGGTHLVLARAEAPIEPGREAPFDLMVDDVEAVRRDCAGRGLAPSRLRTSRVHRSFTLAGPDGWALTVTSSHAGDRPV